MSNTSQKKEQRTRRHAKVRARIVGTMECPRLAVFRSNKYISAQLVDDTTSTTLAHATSQNLTSGTPMEKAVAVGKSLAEKATAQNIQKVVFDRGGFLYTGQIKALADGAREGGLTF